MKSPNLSVSPRAVEPGEKVRRRGVVVGAGVAAGAALAVAALPRKPDAEAAATAKADARPAADGYRLTDHIRRYYETTRT